MTGQDLGTAISTKSKRWSRFYLPVPPFFNCSLDYCWKSWTDETNLKLVDDLIEQRSSVIMKSVNIIAFQTVYTCAARLGTMLNKSNFWSEIFSIFFALWAIFSLPLSGRENCRVPNDGQRRRETGDNETNKVAGETSDWPISRRQPWRQQLMMILIGRAVTLHQSRDAGACYFICERGKTLGLLSRIKWPATKAFLR